MRILIFSHHGNKGGAQNALFNLATILKSRHTVEVAFPDKSGDLINRLINSGINCFHFPAIWILPNVVESLMKVDLGHYESIAATLSDRYDILISNTGVIGYGGIISRLMNKPHISYIHEDIVNFEEFTPVGMSGNYFMSQMMAQSEHMFFCSKFIARQWGSEDGSVIYPFSFRVPVKRPVIDDDGVLHLLLIGVNSERKNFEFSLILGKALRLRGGRVKLHLIGESGNASSSFESKKNLRQFFDVEMHGVLEDPYQGFLDKRAITLVTSIAEPFGLTITESLQRGIPVVASDSGGAAELIPEMVYPINDLDACVRLIEQINSKYEDYVDFALDRYAQLSAVNDPQLVADRVEAGLKAATMKHFNPMGGFIRFIKPGGLFDQIRKAPLSKDEIIDNICNVAKYTDCPLDRKSVLDRVLLESLQPGAAVHEDVRRFDVVPYAYSENMEKLYRNGVGLAIELLATGESVGKVSMLAFIILWLQEFSESERGYTVLALGDGLGLDSIRIAQSGISVDYLDFDGSNMSKIAKLNNEAVFGSCSGKGVNFVDKLEGVYSCIVCLEVIEHVENPLAFVEMLSRHIEPGGLLFISECFMGITDAWQTHLVSNERFSSLLPIMLASDFEFVSVNCSPYGKPYVFRKKENGKSAVETILKLNKKFLQTFIQSRAALGEL